MMLCAIVPWNRILDKSQPCQRLPRSAGDPGSTDQNRKKRDEMSSRNVPDDICRGPWHIATCGSEFTRHQLAQRRKTNQRASLVSLQKLFS